jgi:hypothetical protein
MKTQKLKNTLSVIILALFCTALFQACKKDRKGNSANDIREFTTLFGPKEQKKQIDPTKENTFTLSGGTKISIPANAFTSNGNSVTGSVVITAIEYLKRSDVVFGGTNTNHVSGKPLESDGFIYLSATLNGVQVDKALNAGIIVSIPTTNTRATQIWEGTPDPNNDEQMVWNIPAQNANGIGVKRESNAEEGFYNFQMANLGWYNCDVLYNNDAVRTTTTVTLTNNPGTFANFRGFDGETFVLFCAKGSNVVAQLYTPAGPNAVKSYDNVMPIGTVGKYISLSIKDGKYYYAEMETSIVANQSISLTLVETTEAQIQQAITELNNY